MFWLMIIIASIGAVYLMMEPVVELGMEINYTPDTLYLDWTTTFPAFTVCEELVNKLVQRKINAIYPYLLETLNFNHRRYLADLLYARGQCSAAMCDPCGAIIPCDVPWRRVIERLVERERATNIIHPHSPTLAFISRYTKHATKCYRNAVRYSGVEFPCCQHFQTVDSERGSCYSFNTLQTRNHTNLFAVNRTTGPAALKFRLLSDAEVSIHSSEDLSTNNLDTKLKRTIRPGVENHAVWLFSVVEMENDVLLMDEQVHHRGCRFLHEIPDEKFHTYPVYSHGACQLARNTEETYKHCGCIHPVRDLSYEKYFCNYTGMNCWNMFEEHRAKVAAEKTTAKDECLPSCDESELTTVHFSKGWVPMENYRPGTLVNIEMAALPTLRYQRNLIRTHLDLVVSVGGIAGLFFSASILSFLEIFYLILRPQRFETLS